MEGSSWRFRDGMVGCRFFRHLTPSGVNQGSAAAHPQVGMAVESWAESAMVHGSRLGSPRAEPGPRWVELRGKQRAFEEPLWPGWKPDRCIAPTRARGPGRQCRPSSMDTLDEF